MLLILLMAEKQRYTVSLPDHISAELDKRAKAISATPTEYAADIIRWWFGQGCPPVTHDELELQRRLHPIPPNLDAWHLDESKSYMISDDAVVQKLLTQLGIPNLFSQAKEHDEIRFMVAFDNHPTHWLEFNFFKGIGTKDGDGLSFIAYPKKSTTRQQMLHKLEEEAKAMEAAGPIQFSQIPATSMAESSHRK